MIPPVWLENRTTRLQDDHIPSQLTRGFFKAALGHILWDFLEEVAKLAGWGFRASQDGGQESGSSVPVYTGLQGRGCGCIWFLRWPFFYGNTCPPWPCFRPACSHRARPGAESLHHAQGVGGLLAPCLGWVLRPSWEMRKHCPLSTGLLAPRGGCF